MKYQVSKELDTDKILGQLVISHSQRMIFAATAEAERPGCVRIYKFPLTGDYIEYTCLSSPGNSTVPRKLQLVFT